MSTFPSNSHLFYPRFRRWRTFTSLLAVALTLMGCHGSQNQEHNHEAHAHATATYTCSMHPQIKQPNPGNCPICGMALIPMDHSDDGDLHEWAITFSENAKRLAEIHTTPVRRALTGKEIRLTGRLELDETRIRTLASRFPGRVDRLFVDYVGVPVNEGDHLAEVFSPFLLNAQAELLNALRYDSQGLSLRGAREKLRLLGLSDTGIREIEERGTASDRLQIDAPVSGVVIEKKINEGDYIETGTLLFRVAEMDRLWLILEAYEVDLAWLRFGQKVHFTVKSNPGQQFEGTIAFIQPMVDPGMRTVKVRVNVDNPQRLLKPGMYAQGIVHAKLSAEGKVIAPELAGKWISPMHPEIVKDHPGSCDICGMALVPAEQLGYTSVPESGEDHRETLPLVIPASSILRTGKRAIVYVEVPDRDRPTYEGREIVLGTRAGDFYLVESGLSEGERVVSQGAFKIDSSLQIQGKQSMMAFPGENHGHSHTTPDSPAVAGPVEPYSGFHKVFDPLLQTYFKLQHSLAMDQLEEARQHAREMESLLAPIPLEDRGIGLAALQRILQAQNLEAARRPFEPLSDWITEWLQSYGTSLESRIWRMSCPMVFGNYTGYWLQNHDQLLNPYHGSGMLHCGNTEGLLVDHPAQKN